MVDLLSRLRGCLVLAAATLAGILCQTAAGEVCEVSFRELPIFEIGKNGGTSALADLDGDGNLDLITGEFFFLGEGNGHFGASKRVLPDPGLPLFDIVPRDFDDDGRLDLAMGSIVGESVIFCFGRVPGDPTDAYFEPPLEIPSVHGPWHLAPADFNEDGRPDVAAVGRGESGRADLFVNNGDRTFVAMSSHPGMDVPGHALAVGDFDGDGHTDIAQGVGSFVFLSFGHGDATFDRPVQSAIRHELELIAAHRYRSADLDGDGRSDLGVIGEDVVLLYLCGIDREDGLPAEPTVALSLTGIGRFMEFADMNNDGVLDVVAQSVDDGRARVQVFYTSQVSPCDIAFIAGTSFETEIDDGCVLVVGDVNGDGAHDIVLTTEGSDEGQVFLSDASCLAREAQPGDTNADGDVDISDPVATLAHLFLGGEINCLPAAEVTGDGKVDISDPIYVLQFLFMGGSPLPDTGPVACQAEEET